MGCDFKRRRFANSRKMIKGGDNIGMLGAVVGHVEAQSETCVDEQPDWDTDDPVPSAEEKEADEVKGLDCPGRSSQAGGNDTRSV
jgi:hypothetical protein